MSCIYLVNVGANTSHSPRARSPIFSDGSFKYVSFPYRTDERSSSPDYPAELLPFVRMDRLVGWATHADPDWKNLTYGDFCANARAAALVKVQPGDVLLFWGLLWEHTGRGWDGFTGRQAWCLLGAIRVQHIVHDRASLMHLSRTDQVRARANAHLNGGSDLENDHRIFLGNLTSSIRFARAVDLKASRPDGLLYKAFTTADRSPLARNSKPHWSSSLRTCRKMWDLNDSADLARAELVRREIKRLNDYDLLGLA